MLIIKKKKAFIANYYYLCCTFRSFFCLHPFSPIIEWLPILLCFWTILLLIVCHIFVLLLKYKQYMLRLLTHSLLFCDSHHYAVDRSAKCQGGPIIHEKAYAYNDCYSIVYYLHSRDLGIIYSSRFVLSIEKHVFKFSSQYLSLLLSTVTNIVQ